MAIAFWIAVIALGVPLYAYVVYPAVLFVLAALVQTGRDVYYLWHRRERRTHVRSLPPVSVVIAACNEADVIAATLERLLSSDYPSEKLQIIVGSDGSSDTTAEVAGCYASRGVQVLQFMERRGKLAVLNDCVAAATGDVLVLTDANTAVEPDALRKLVRHFDQPRIGAVCGELRLTTAEGKPRDEGVYWRYEMMLKILENRLNAVLGANGAIYAVRRELWPMPERELITEDFVIPMKIRAEGWHVVYDPEAMATEEAPASPADEFRRRRRIGAGNWQALWECRRVLLPWKGFIAFSFWSHKVLRWLTPFCLPMGLAANLFLVGVPFWRSVLAVQFAFYSAAAVGNVLRRLRLPAGPLRLPGYFVTINTALGVGMVRGALGLQRAAWQRTARHAPRERSQ